MTALAGWQNFYVIAGSSAGALIGLQFVVLSLIASRPVRTDVETGDAFATPTIVHFGCVLGLSGMLSAPWDGIEIPTILLGMVGAGGVLYSIRVTRRMRKQTIYRPEFEDWLFHAVLPLAAYFILVGSAYLTGWNPKEGLFACGGGMMMLLFVGIHNAWDAVTYHVLVQSRDPDRQR